MFEYEWKSRNVKTCGVDDMVLLSKTDIPTISENLKKRLDGDVIYTYIGPVLIAVNPFKQLGCYTERELDKYQNSTSYENAPHIYYIGDCAFRGLITDRENQGVIISGESGAGKTVNAKYLMNYITKVAGGGHNVQRIKDIIIQSNPLLEAFGNAKTLRNDNSSRFGKYVEILFVGGGIPVGGKISNFLLEKSRVCRQNQGERCFHIFYQMLAGLDHHKKQELSLSSPEDFRFLSQSGCFTVNTIDDVQDFKDVLVSMDVIEIPQDTQESIFRLVAGILHLGNVIFDENNDQTYSRNFDAIQRAANFFKVDANGLQKVLISKNMDSKWGGKTERIEVKLNPEQAAFALEAVAKAIYTRLFSYLVEAINKAIHTQKYEKSIGILDIYGFEIFQSNGFEQFCINYVNEKLQQIFIELTLKTEQEEYVNEGIEWTEIKYFNNKTVCDLIENTNNPPGIISIMDDVCATMHATGEGADAKLINDLSKFFSSHKHYVTSGAGFMIKHYAGNVTYDSMGFCEKNRDVLFPDAIELLQSSQCKFLKNLFPENLATVKQGRPSTAGSKIRSQAKELVSKLMGCQPHYVRCIKPNENKRPYEFDLPRVKHQIEYLGLQENIRIKRSGFAYRCPFDKFLSRFAILTPETYPRWHGNDREGIHKIINSANLESKEWQMGRSKIFIKNPESLFLLEEIRDRKFDGYARILQKQWRRTHNQNVYNREKKEATLLLKNQKQRHYASINRKFYGNYFNQDQPIFCGLLEKKEKMAFSIFVTKYDRKFRSVKRDLVITQKNLYLIGREKIQKGPEKGKIIDVVKRKIPIPQLAKLQLSKLQDDFVCIHVKEDYSTLIETPLKTEFVFACCQKYKYITGSDLRVEISDILVVNIKKTGFKLTSNAKVHFNLNPSLPNDMRVVKSGLSSMTVSVRPGKDASSMPQSHSNQGQDQYSQGYQSRQPPQPTFNAKSYQSQQPAYNQSPMNQSAPPMPNKKPPPIPGFKKKENLCKAVWDYDSSDPNDISFSAGDVITIIEENSDWWIGEFNGKRGQFPGNYVEKL